MLLRLTPRMEALCSRAEVAGDSTPIAPSTIRALLKLIIKRLLARVRFCRPLAMDLRTTSSRSGRTPTPTFR